MQSPVFLMHRKLLKTIENRALAIYVIKHVYVVKKRISLKLLIAKNNNVKLIVYFY